MLQNVSRYERLVSMAIGSFLVTRGLFAKSTAGRVSQGTLGAGLLWRGMTGYCPVYQSMGIESFGKPMFIERSIVIDKSLEEVREIIGEGDPLWYESSRKIFPITAGNLLWDLFMQEIGDGHLTLIRATLSEQNSTFGLKTRLTPQGLRHLADAELRKLKDLVEADGYEEKGNSSSGLH